MHQPTVQESMIVATLAVSVFSLWWFIANKWKKHYVHVGKVSRLFFYPVKSLTGIEVSSVNCVEKGIQIGGFNDRCYSLITQGNHDVCSQIKEPRLALLTPRICGNRLFISGPEMEDLVLEIKRSPSPSDKIVPCRIDGEEAQGIDCGDEAAAWFQKFLKNPDVRLIYNAETVGKRKVIKNRPLLKKIRDKTNVSFQNAAPFHLLTQESIDDLNSKLKETTKISVFNFRPNILIEGCNPYDEDNWSSLKFSSGAEIDHQMACARCVQTTNDPQTGIQSNKEPLVTLRKYRTSTDENFRANFGKGPIFGGRYGLRKQGEIAIGDDVYAVMDQNLSPIK